ncbi:MAG: CRISPR-associated endonuclease Cas2 [Quinella sp. 1Q7]|nr:CRISPR-associated endonuclease Cas2 [Quinella sp. 1Q7]
MRYIICYDIPDDKTRGNIVNYLEGFAWRVQYSVFSCRLDRAQAALVWKDLLAISDATEGNSVLMVPLCKACEKNLQLSAKPLEVEKGFLVV